ncbi:hypothetical protein T439DRAFT_329803 [Meredithblackwellia eburnea MCA 4105]
MDTTLDAESFFIITLFQQGSYRSAISAFESHGNPTPLLSTYAARAHLALTPPATDAALALLAPLPQTLDTRAVTALANYLAGLREESVGELDELLAELGEGGLEEGDEGRLVRGVVGTVFILEGEERREEGVEVLREAVELGKDQECLGVLSHLYLSLSLASHSHTLINSPGTTSWTADSLLSQILSARTNLVTGPTAKYQEAYYVFEEVKGMQGGRGETSLAGITVSQALLGRWDEASQATEEALEMNPSHPTTLANSVALALHIGKPPAVAEANLAKLQQVDPYHPLLVDLAAKESAFDEAASRFAVSVA